MHIYITYTYLLQPPEVENEKKHHNVYALRAGFDARAPRSLVQGEGVQAPRVEIKTSWPCSMRRSTRCEPTNPAPPVTCPIAVRYYTTRKEIPAGSASMPWQWAARRQTSTRILRGAFLKICFCSPKFWGLKEVCALPSASSLVSAPALIRRNLWSSCCFTSCVTRASIISFILSWLKARGPPPPPPFFPAMYTQPSSASTTGTTSRMSTCESAPCTRAQAG